MDILYIILHHIALYCVVLYCNEQMKQEIQINSYFKYKLTVFQIYFFYMTQNKYKNL